LRIEIPILRVLKQRIRAALGIKRKQRPSRLLPPLEGVALREIAPDSIRIQSAEGRILVSVIIPAYGQVDHTLNCLASIAHNPPRSAIEILVVDDASHDPRVAELRRVAGIRLIENSKNLGFLRSCNSAAATARGLYLLFLNNDTILAPGAIDALVEIAERTPDAGLVGSRLLYPNGRLQEAGAIIWDDASIWNYGRLDHPGKCEYRYLREADYISGASILIPRSVWDELGGFDEVYAPAYCEDSDFAFRARRKGKRVYFQPASTVYHFEGISHGTDPNRGVKAYQTAHQKIFAERWAATLKSEHFPPGRRLMRARDRAKSRRIILVVDRYAPEPDRDAGSRSMIDIIRRLKEAGWIVKFWPQNLQFEPAYVPPLQQMGVEVLYRPYEDSLEHWLADNGGEIDAVLLSRPAVAEDLLDVVMRGTKAPIVYYGHDLHFARQRLEAELAGDAEKALGADDMEALERRIWRAVDTVVYPSEEEAAVVRRLEPGVEALALSAYCFDRFKKRAKAVAGKSILFVAGFGHPPNVDAAVWLAQEIFPLVKRAHPEATLSLVGSNPSETVRALANPDVEVAGWVSAEDLEARYAEARLAAVPLRVGAGVKLKVVEALVEGVPLVTTPVGAQGLEGLEEVATITESAETFAAAICRLIEADDLAWLEAARRQADYAADRFGRERMTDSLLAAIGAAERRRKLDPRAGRSRKPRAVRRRPA
jgi:GT2 family glycosyltransferase